MTVRAWLDLRAWLESHGCTDVVPVEVTIGRTTYRGCRYKQRFEIHPGCRAWSEGEREYVKEAIYLLGELPPTYKRSRRVAFVLAGEPHEWYIGSWVRKEVAIDPLFEQFHFGEAAFQMMPWRDGTIDYGEKRPYRRVEAEIEEARVAP